MKLSKLVLVLAGSAVGLAGVACGGDSSDADVTATLRDDGIELSTDSVAAGDLTIAGTNEGTLTHEFEVFGVPEGVDANALPVEDDVAAADEMLELVDEVEDIAPSTTGELNLNLEAGEYAVICNLSGHYENGMHATFTVA